MKKVVLISRSPRRKELLKRIVPVFEVIGPSVDELIDTSLSPKELVLSLANRKMDSIKRKYNRIYIAADTVVEVEGEVLGKPKDYEDAFRMLKELSGKRHFVHTAVVVFGKKRLSTVVTTEVVFRKISDSEIRYYLDSFKPFDKAGAYGIQDMAEVFVESIKGSFSNVVGLPLAETYKLMREVGFELYRWIPLKELASVIRSKNAGPFELTFDIIFSNEKLYHRFKELNFLTPEVFAGLYNIDTSEISVFEYFDQALALKITIRRKVPSGNVEDTDIYGAAQHVPLMNLLIPWECYG